MDLDVGVASDGQELDGCKLVALEPDRARVKTAGSPLEPGLHAVLALRDPGSRAALHVPAIAGRSLGDGHVFELLFVEPDPVAVRPTDRRRSVRVVPDEDTRIEVWLEESTDAPLVRAELVDLGEDGLCVDHPAFRFKFRATVQVLMPGQAFPLALAVRICHHQRLPSGLERCGYEIAWHRTADRDLQHDLLATWVAEYRALVVRRLQRGARHA